MRASLWSEGASTSMSSPRSPGTSRAGFVPGFGSGKVDIHSLHADRSFHGGAVESTGENHVGRSAFDGQVDGEAELIGAEITAEDVGVAVGANDGPRK